MEQDAAEKQSEEQEPVPTEAPDLTTPEGLLKYLIGNPDADIERIDDDEVWGNVSIVRLKKPIPWHDKRITELKLHEPIGEELVEADREKGENGKGLRIIAAVSGIPYGAVKKVRARDFNRLMAELAFLQRA